MRTVRATKKGAEARILFPNTLPPACQEITILPLRDVENKTPRPTSSQK